jgi:tetratricopeptide (TPR) repeat protein
MVSEWLHIQCDEGSQSTFMTATVEHIEHYLDAESDGDHTAKQESLLHIDTICQAAIFSSTCNCFLGACLSFSSFYRDQDRLDDVEKIYNCALAGFEKALGPKHTSTLDIVNNLGVLYANQDQLNEAERMFTHALAGYEKSLEPQHTSTLDMVNNLSILQRHQGQLDEAERMYTRALAGYEKALGPEHTSTLDTVNNLGILYAHQGQLDEQRGCTLVHWQAMRRHWDLNTHPLLG